MPISCSLRGPGLQTICWFHCSWKHNVGPPFIAKLVRTISITMVYDTYSELGFINQQTSLWGPTAPHVQHWQHNRCNDVVASSTRILLEIHGLWVHFIFFMVVLMLRAQWQLVHQIFQTSIDIDYPSNSSRCFPASFRTLDLTHTLAFLVNIPIHPQMRTMVLEYLYIKKKTKIAQFCIKCRDSYSSTMVRIWDLIVGLLAALPTKNKAIDTQTWVVEIRLCFSSAIDLQGVARYIIWLWLTRLAMERSTMLLKSVKLYHGELLVITTIFNR